jgi:hypothetical protein
VPAETSEKIFNTTKCHFVRGLGTPNPGTMSPLVDFVNGAVGAEDVLVTNFGWNNLYFYTNRRQRVGISPDATAVYDAAKAAGLPAYVFGLETRALADLAPNRSASEHAPGSAPRSRRAARLEPVAQFRETLWEIRPEPHWHRFRAGATSRRDSSTPGASFPTQCHRIDRAADPAPRARVSRRCARTAWRPTGAPSGPSRPVGGAESRSVAPLDRR